MTPEAQPVPPLPEDATFEQHEAFENALAKGEAPPAIVEEPPAVEPPPTDADRTETGQFKKRGPHKGARAADVPRIQELTAKWRSTEEERDALKARVAELEARQSTPPPRVDTPPTKPVETKDDPEPTQEPFLADPVKYPDPYAAWLRATMQWELRQRDKASAAAATKVEADRAARDEFDHTLKSYQQRASAFAKEHPDFDAVLKKADQTLGENNMTPVMQAAMLTHDNGPAFGYYLAQHPEVHAEVFLGTTGKPVTPQTVAAAQRLLEARLVTGTTGSVPPMRPNRAPSPPNPVRSGALTPADSPPGPDDSFEAHERYENAKERRASR